MRDVTLVDVECTSKIMIVQGKPESLIGLRSVFRIISHGVPCRGSRVRKPSTSQQAPVDKPVGCIMESISRLRAILLTSLGSRGAQHGEQELFDELMVHQQRLLTLLDVGPRNAQEQREIESGE